MSAPQNGPIKRRNVRWKPQPKDCAYISFTPSSRPFESELCALIVDQSHNGCCLIALADARLVKGTTLRVQLGPLDPLVGEVRWVAAIDDRTLRIGCEFLVSPPPQAAGARR